MSQTTTIPAQTTAKETSTYLSPSCQKLLLSDFPTTSTAHLKIHTNLTAPPIYPVITQHLCNSTQLTSSGIWADMAFVAGKHIWQRLRSSTEGLGLRVGNMVVDHPYIIPDPPKEEGHWVEMEAALEVPDGSSGNLLDGSVSCTFHKITPRGIRVQELARCNVNFDWEIGWLDSWTLHAGPINAAVARLETRAKTESSGDMQLMHREKAYRLFKSFVDYGRKYQNMSSVVVDTRNLEAVAVHDFQPDPERDYCGPFYIDGSCHLSGFVCNTADEDMKKNAYVSRGFKAMMLSSKFDPAKGGEIKTYVHMRPDEKDKTVLKGDVFVLQEHEVVGLWEAVSFERIPRRVLDVFLPPPKEKK